MAKQVAVRKIKAWAVIARGRPVDNERDLHSMLIFRRRWQAEAAIWKKGESVIPILILPGEK